MRNQNQDTLKAQDGPIYKAIERNNAEANAINEVIECDDQRRALLNS